jgi:hypothetical protein
MMTIACAAVMYAQTESSFNAAQPLEWKLLGRSVAKVSTPLGDGTGFLIGPEWLVTSSRLVLGVAPEKVRMFFRDPLADPRTGNTGEDAWQGSYVSLALVDAGLGFAYVRIAPKGGLYAGESYGYIGARKDPPRSGESVHVIGVAPGGAKTYSRDEHIFSLDYDHGTGHSVGSFSHRAPAGDSIGAPVFDDSGCLLGIQALCNGGTSSVITVAYLRELTQPDAGAIELCHGPLDTREYSRLGMGGDGEMRLPGSGDGGGGGLPFGGGGGGGGGAGGPDLGPSGGFRFDPPEFLETGQSIPAAPSEPRVFPPQTDTLPVRPPTPKRQLFPIDPPGSPSDDNDLPFSPPPMSPPPDGPPSDPPPGGPPGDPPIPEPASLLLLGLGTLSLLRRRR